MQVLESSHQTAPSLPWFVLRVRSNFEKITSTYLQSKGYEEFTPVYWARRRWSDRVKKLEAPLFPGYVFCRFDPQRRLPILQTPGVVTIVSFGGQPTPVAEEEIGAIRAIVRSGCETEPWPFLRVGQRVRLIGGPLRGLEGILHEMNGNGRKLVASVTLLQRSVAVEIDRADVEPVL